MKKPVQILLLALLLAAPVVGADWTYSYTDDFSTDKAQSDAYLHSTFWASGATLLPEPCVQYLAGETGRGLAFMEYKEQLAQFGYRLPVGAAQTRRMIAGTITVDVSFPCNTEISQFPAGELFYSISPDGTAWSEKQSLGAGQNTIPIRSTEGACYVLFSGARAMIDDVRVSLSEEKATMRVPSEFATIQKAIDAARDGDVIEVAPATYLGSGNWDLDFRGKSIIVRSAAGPQSTTIRCDSGHRGFYFHQGETADSVLSGFTIRGGRINGANIPGGGIYCEYSSPTIINCVVEDCGAQLGGGIGCIGGEPAIIGCTIKKCTASSAGAGLYVLDSTATVVGCTISENSASGSVRGGGAYCAGEADVTFKNCIIAGNSAKAGAGILVEQSAGGVAWGEQCSVSIVNCTIAQNRLTSASGGSGGGVDVGDGDVTILNSIIWDNGGAGIAPTYAASVNYSDIQGGYFGQGNLSADPQFADSVFHLGAQSPCIDAGDPSFPAGGEPSPNGSRVNMGADGGTIEARTSLRSILYVDGTRSRQPSYSTIQAAIEAARDGDTILVWPGVYREEITFRGKAITVRSAADAAVITAPNGYACSFQGAESPRSILSNFVITGCGEGGIFCDVGASPTLKNLTIAKNTIGIQTFGGADPDIINCIIWENTVSSLFAWSGYTWKISYSCVEPTAWDTKSSNISPTAGNISTDPLFANSKNGDYHLRSQYGRYVPATGKWVLDSVMSPCIDAGDPSEQPRDERMPNGALINMGAHGGTPYASLSDGPVCP